MEIRQVETGAQLKDFVEFPYKLYKGHPYWVPPLKSEIYELFSEKNPFWKHTDRQLYTVYEGGEPAGRIAALIDSAHNEFHGEKCGFFGFYECTEDIKVSRLLLETASRYLKEKGMTAIRGPFNPSTNDECGLLIEGFDDPPKIMMTYNFPYYVDFLVDAGFYKAKDLLAFMMEVEEGPVKRLFPVADRVMKRNPRLSVRKANLKDFSNEVKIIMDIYNSAWEKNWGFVPMNNDEIFYMAGKLKRVVDPEILRLAFYGSEPAGFLMALPDINEAFRKIDGRLTPMNMIKLFLYTRNMKNLRLLTLGVKRKFHKLGIESLLYAKTLEAALKKGYKKCEFSWILEDNLMTVRAAGMMSGKLYKKYRIFEKPLA